VPDYPASNRFADGNGFSVKGLWFPGFFCFNESLKMGWPHYLTRHAVSLQNYFLRFFDNVLT
jgi:hypothetical protein